MVCYAPATWSTMKSIAFFITPHGFGHAARACAVMQALRRTRPASELHIYTRVPRWFFLDSLGEGGWYYHEEMTDIGLVQSSPLQEDLPATLAALDAFLPFSDALLDRLAAQVTEQGCGLVVCDIAPLGIAVARRAGIASAVVENFTWDWIYQGYVEAEPRLARHADYLAGLTGLADVHVQTEPVCARSPAQLATPPVSRPPRLGATATRAKLGVPPDPPLILLSFGGIPQRDFPTLDMFHERSACTFVVPGAATPKVLRDGNVILLPHHSDFYHPDLIHAADLLVGKLGASTVGEAWQAGIAYSYIPRPGFRESAVLAEFVERELGAQLLEEQDFLTGAWLDELPRRLAGRRGPRQGDTAAEQIAALLLGAQRLQKS